MGTSFVVSVFLQDGARLQRDRDGRRSSPPRPSASWSRRFAAERLAKEVRAADADRRRLRRHAGRDRAPARLRRSLVERRRVRARAAAHRPRPGRDADALGQRRPVELPGGAAGRDLGPLAQRLQPGLVVRHRDRRHDPRLRRRRREPVLRRSRWSSSPCSGSSVSARRCSFPPSSSGLPEPAACRPSGSSVLPEVLVHEGDRHAALADCRRDALHGAESDVAAGEDARDARLEEVRVPVELPRPASPTSGPVST